MTKSKQPLLFLTLSEHGQSTVHLAVIQQLLTKDEFDLHIGSFEPLRPRLDAINEVSKSSQVKFHTIRGPTLSQVMERNNKIEATPSHTPGLRGLTAAATFGSNSLLGFTADEYIEQYTSLVDMIASLQPALVILDFALHSSMDACKSSGVRFATLWPTALSQVVAASQPGIQALWKYPFSGSGYSYPIPWYLVPANIFGALHSYTSYLSSNNAKRWYEARKINGSTHDFELVDCFDHKNLNICPGLPELDYPCYIPRHVMSVGPILPLTSLIDSDPSLNDWLAFGPTLLINLGSLFHYDLHDATETVHAILAFLNRREENRVLWKVRFKNKEDASHVQLLLDGIDSKRLKILSWLKPAPMSILLSGHINGFVHHGGANSFFEGCKSGIPQIVLGQWVDTYDYAARAEYLNIGVFGNKGSAPKMDRKEFGNAMIKITEDKHLKAQAAAVGRVCAKTEGRDVAAELITRYVHEGNFWEA